MHVSLPKSCFRSYIGPELFNDGLESEECHALGVLSYDVTPVDAMPIGVAGSTSNPNGAAGNPFNDQEWDACVDMPFDVPKPAKALEAFDVSDGNAHHIQFNFAQVQHLSKVLVNEVSTGVQKMLGAAPTPSVTRSSLLLLNVWLLIVNVRPTSWVSQHGDRRILTSIAKADIHCQRLLAVTGTPRE